MVKAQKLREKYNAETAMEEAMYAGNQTSDIYRDVQRLPTKPAKKEDGISIKELEMEWDEEPEVDEMFPPEMQSKSDVVNDSVKTDNRQISIPGYKSNINTNDAASVDISQGQLYSYNQSSSEDINDSESVDIDHGQLSYHDPDSPATVIPNFGPTTLIQMNRPNTPNLSTMSALQNTSQGSVLKSEFEKKVAMTPEFKLYQRKHKRRSLNTGFHHFPVPSPSTTNNDDKMSPPKNLFPGLNFNFKIPKKDNYKGSSTDATDTSNEQPLNINSTEQSEQLPGSLTKKTKEMLHKRTHSESSYITCDRITKKKKNNIAEYKIVEVKAMVTASLVKSTKDSIKTETLKNQEGSNVVRTEADVGYIEKSPELLSPYSTNIKSLTDHEIVKLLKNPDTTKVLHAKCNEPNPNEIYIYDYISLGLSTSCDVISWRNDGVKCIPWSDPLCKKVYYNCIKNDLRYSALKKKLCYFDDKEQRKYVLAYYEDTGDNRSSGDAILYMNTQQTNIEINDILSILKKPDTRKVSITKVLKPRGGDVYVFDTDVICKWEYRSDSYSWKMHQLKDIIEEDGSLCKKFVYHMRTNNGKVTNKFIKEEYYFVNESGEYALVHYMCNDNFSPRMYKKAVLQPSLISKIKLLARLSSNNNSSNVDIETNTKKSLKDELYNLQILAHTLNGFIKCVDIHPQVICVIGLTTLMDSFNKLLEVKSDVPVACIFDQTYKLHNYFLTPILFRHNGLVNYPVFPLAYVVHESIDEFPYTKCLSVIMKCIPNMSQIMIPIVVSTEHNLKMAVKRKLSFWPILHRKAEIMQDFVFKIKQTDEIDENDIELYIADFQQLLSCDSADELPTLETNLVNNWNRTMKCYYDEEMKQNINEHCSQWTLDQYKCPELLGEDRKLPPDNLKQILCDLEEQPNLSVEIIVLSLFLLQKFVFSELLESSTNRGKYSYIDGFTQSLYTSCKDKESKSIVNYTLNDIVTIALETADSHHELCHNLRNEEQPRVIMLKENQRPKEQAAADVENPHHQNINKILSRNDIINSIVEAGNIKYVPANVSVLLGGV